MRQCSFIKPNGGRCKGVATEQHGLCWAHDPKNAEQRHRQASRAAKAKPSREIRTLKSEIKVIIDDVRDGHLDRQSGAVMLHGYRTLRDDIELERRVREQDELVERLEAVES